MDQAAGAPEGRDAAGDAAGLRDRYVARLGLEVAGRGRDLALLRELQVAHLIAVPFENLDVFHRRGPRTGVDWSVPKVVDRRRGGWCFELNGAFGWLLRQLGFAVDYVSCRVFQDGAWGPPFDHCSLVVHLDGRRWLVDVGFGDACMVPVALEPGEREGVPRPVGVEVDGEAFRTAEHHADGGWRPALWGRFDPVELDAFTARSDHLQTAPGLAWTKQPFATRATAVDGSRVILRPGVLRVREGSGRFVDTPIDEDDWARLLAEHVGLEDGA